MRIVEMVRNDIKKSSLLRTKILIYAFNGRTIKNMAEKGKMSTEKWVFRGKMGVFRLEINRTSNQTRKVKWCKMQFLFLKTDRVRDMKG